MVTSFDATQAALLHGVEVVFLDVLMKPFESGRALWTSSCISQSTLCPLQGEVTLLTIHQIMVTLPIKLTCPGSWACVPHLPPVHIHSSRSLTSSCPLQLGTSQKSYRAQHLSSPWLWENAQMELVPSVTKMLHQRYFTTQPLTPRRLAESRRKDASADFHVSHYASFRPLFVRCPRGF